MKLMLYRSAPPFVASRRAPARYDFTAGNADNLIGASFVFPLIPVMGRDAIFVSLRWENSGAADVDLKVEGGRLPGAFDDKRLAQRWPSPTGVSVWSAVEGSGGAVEYDDDPLNIESAVTAAALYQYQYAGDYDFLKVSVVRNSGSFHAGLRVVARDY
jgi:hypothetical protein